MREGAGGVPLLLVHGWPETKRIWWRVIEPLAAAGFEVIVPDLRGFGESELGPDGLHDVYAHVHDLHALVTEGLGHDDVVLAGGDLGGPVIQDLALRWPELTGRMVLFNSPLPASSDRYANIGASSAHDYFIRQGTDPDGLATELDDADKRRRYIATFYSSRFWAHNGAFEADAISFHTEPFADGAKFRASFGAYESVFNPDARSGRVELPRQPRDHDLGPLRSIRSCDPLWVRRACCRGLPGSRRAVPATRLRPLRTLGSRARVHLGDDRFLWRPTAGSQAFVDHLSVAEGQLVRRV